MLAHDIGRAVARARQRVGVSLEELADRTSLDEPLLISLERGDQLVSTAKLDRIASALGIDAFALYAGRDVERELIVLPRHAARADFQHEDLPVLRRALERATALFEVSSLLGRTTLAGLFEPKRTGFSRPSVLRPGPADACRGGSCGGMGGRHRSMPLGRSRARRTPRTDLRRGPRADGPQQESPEGPAAHAATGGARACASGSG